MSRVMGAALCGVDGFPVEVEVRISSQLPRIDVVGLPEAAVRESSARVRAAIAASGEPFPGQRITVNLAPAGRRKSGPGLDLPIAVGVLAAAGAIEAEALDGLGMLGELALDGRLRPVRGALALTLALAAAGCRRVVVPRDNGAEAALAPGLEVHTAPDLHHALAALRGGPPLARALPVPDLGDRGGAPQPDLREIRGQERAKRALEIAAAGGHALLLLGPPGSGKTMLARRLPGLLPPLSFEEALEVTRIRSVAGRTGEQLESSRPFRAPHHTASVAGLLGGGSPPGPGEVSLAHRGVLFLDELAEFPRRCLEALRQVLEERQVALARARASAVLPAHFQLVAASNPCPCGWRLSMQRECSCDDGVAARYTARLSGPLLDRIDLHVGVPAVVWAELDAPADGPSSQVVRERVGEARKRQRGRLGAFGAQCNAEIPAGAVDAAVVATSEARVLLGRAMDRLALSARGAHRVLRVARSVADLAGEVEVGRDAVAEALSFRSPAEGGRDGGVSARGRRVP